MAITVSEPPSPLRPAHGWRDSRQPTSLVRACHPLSDAGGCFAGDRVLFDAPGAFRTRAAPRRLELGTPPLGASGFSHLHGAVAIAHLQPDCLSAAAVGEPGLCSR